CLWRDGPRWRHRHDPEPRLPPALGYAGPALLSPATARARTPAPTVRRIPRTRATLPTDRRSGRGDPAVGAALIRRPARAQLRVWPIGSRQSGVLPPLLA